MMNQIQCEMLGVCVCECVCFLAGHFRIQLKKATKGMKRKKNRHTESEIEKREKRTWKTLKLVFAERTGTFALITYAYTELRERERKWTSVWLILNRRTKTALSSFISFSSSSDATDAATAAAAFCWWPTFKNPKTGWTAAVSISIHSIISNGFQTNFGITLCCIFFSILFFLSQFAVCVWTKEWIKKAHTPQLKMYNCNVLAVVNQSFWCMKSAEWRKWEKIRRLTPYINIIANRNVNLRLWYCIVFSAKLRPKSHSGTLWLMLSSLILRYKF